MLSCAAASKVVSAIPLRRYYSNDGPPELSRTKVPIHSTPKSIDKG